MPRLKDNKRSAVATAILAEGPNSRAPKLMDQVRDYCKADGLQATDADMLNIAMDVMEQRWQQAIDAHHPQNPPGPP